jgi:endonuclease G
MPEARRIPLRAVLLAWLWLAAGPAHASLGPGFQMLLGNPTSATADTNNHDHYLIQRDIEALDYNDHRRQPNWASWNLTTDDLGSSGRTGTFHTDTNLPPNFDWVTYGDYTGSGYDRGHMCPSADRTVTTNANVETFLMSNIIPQAPDNNQGIWADLEDYCRTLASAGNEVLITCGPEGFGTNVTDSAGALPIASNVWKIIVVVPQGPGGALDRLTSTSRVIAVKIPNVQGIRNDPWQNYLTTVNALQECTGFTFFSAVDPGLAPILRARLDGAPPDGITGFTPANAPANTSVTLTGTNFSGATTVAFNGIAASFTLDSATQITATVPTNATTGPVSVIAAGGLAVSATPFKVSSAATNATALPPMLTAAGYSNQVFRFTVTGSNGTNYVVQSTTSLTTPQWAALVTNAAPFEFIETNSVAPQLFYRAGLLSDAGLNQVQSATR